MKQSRLLAPRNPFVAAARFKRAGVHEKPEKAKRRDERMRLMREVRAYDKDRGSLKAAAFSGKS